MWSFLQSLKVLMVCFSSALLLEGVAALDPVPERDLQQDEVAPVPDTVFTDADGNLHNVARCATKRNVTSVNRKLRRQSQTVAVPDSKVDIPIKFHVVTNTSGYGNVSDNTILDQIRVLNEAFADSMFNFSLNPASDILRHVDNEFASSCFRRKNRMKMTFGIDIADAMNVYTCDLDGTLGHSSWPDDYPEFHKLHGVLIRFNTMPGGNSGPFNLGHTLTHEVGHYLGLRHTFEGGCDGSKGGVEGDGVSDTPAEKEAAKGCPIGRDTCPFSPGLDPVTNYMDYSHDSCMTHFTPGQATRMHTETASYRPTLYYKL